MKLSPLKKITSKNRPPVDHIHIKDGKIIATDTFSLIETKAPEGITKNGAIKAEDIKGAHYLGHTEDGAPIVQTKKGEQLSIDTKETRDPFPEYEQLIPEDNEDTNTLKLNKKYLINLLSAIPEDTIILTTQKDETKPVKITSEDNNTKALIMPLIMKIK
jgi:DNA polymerase III sliding clamp (beta) subunit (PCNA family)